MNKIEKLAEKIKSGKYPKQKIKLQPFFRRTVTGEIIPDRERRYQVRDNDRDVDRINRAVNKIPVEKVDVHENDVKRELYQIMDERAEEGLDPKPPEQELVALCNRYPQISRGTVGQWISNREDVGGRRKPLITYTGGELTQAMNALASLDRYKDHAICKPRTLVAWFDTGVGAAFDEMAVQGKKKALIVLYCNTTAMVNSWEKGDYKKNIEEKIKLYKKDYRRIIEVEMLRYE